MLLCSYVEDCEHRSGELGRDELRDCLKSLDVELDNEEFNMMVSQALIVWCG